MNRPLHILILPSFYAEPDKPVHRGGLFREQAEKLAQAGVRVGVAYVEQRELRSFTLRKFRENHLQITSSLDSSAILTMRMHAWNPKVTTVTGGKIWAQMALHLVRRYIREHGRPDLLHAHFGIWAGYAASLIERKTGVPYIVTEHASSVALSTTPAAQLPYLKTAYDKARLVVCVSEALAKKVREITPNHIQVSCNLVDTSQFKIEKSNIPSEPFRVISVGNLTAVKNFAMLIRAFADAFGANGDAELTIVGGGVDRADLENIATQSGAKVHFTGALPPATVAQLLPRHHAFALASNVETFGVVLIEAMAAGLPVICTACGGPEQIITPECGVLTPVGDQTAMAQALTSLRQNLPNYDAQIIRDHVLRNFDASQTAPKLLELYNKALKKA